MDGAETTTLSCAECGRQSRDDENAADEWRAYLDINDDLPVFCPDCAERELASAERRLEAGGPPASRGSPK
jgi:DNA-directed RNA polymerase subunit RPC12/RpoP